MAAARPLHCCLPFFSLGGSVGRSVGTAKSRSGGGGGAVRDRRIAVARAVKGRTGRVLRANKRAGMEKGCGRGCVMYDFAQFRHPGNGEIRYKCILLHVRKLEFSSCPASL